MIKAKESTNLNFHILKFRPCISCSQLFQYSCFLLCLCFDLCQYFLLVHLNIMENCQLLYVGVGCG